MKRILSVLAVFFLMIGFAGSAFSQPIKDVSANYWAVKEINAMLEDGIMTLDNGKFYPEQSVTRVQFNSMLLRTLGHKKVAATNENKFNDVSKAYWAYDDILLSDQIGLVYGYPDGTFKPGKYITKAEVASIISHITKEKENSLNSLKKFRDSNNIPAWAQYQYAKTIDMNIYVNHPDQAELLPNKVLNRAEAAVILHKLTLAFNLVKEKFIVNEKILTVEHLNVTKDAAVNEVKITNVRKIVLAQNVVPASFEFPFNSKLVSEGQKVTLISRKDIYSKEGSLIIPRNSKFDGCIVGLVPQKIFNKNAKVTLDMTRFTTPSGKQVPCSAKVFENDGILTPSKWATTGKVTAYTLGGAAIGTGAGVGFAAIPTPKEYGHGVAIGLPVGTGVGLAAGLITPGLAYKADCNDEILLLLNCDLSVMND